MDASGLKTSKVMGEAIEGLYLRQLGRAKKLLKVATILAFFDFQSSVGACDVHWQRENCVRNLSTTSVDASSHPQCQFSVSSQGGDARAIGSVTV